MGERHFPGWRRQPKQGRRRGQRHDCAKSTGIDLYPKTFNGYTVEQVRQLYPRGYCVCGAIVYSSFEHYIAGDW